METLSTKLTLDMLAENVPGAFLAYRATGEGEILFASRELVNLFDCESIDDFMKFTGGSFATLVYPEDIEEVQRTIWDQVNASDGYDYVKYRIITKNGEIRNVENWGRLVCDPELGDIFCVYLHDEESRDKLLSIAGREEDAARRLEKHETDDLTGLTNLRGFRAKAPKLIRRVLEEGANGGKVFCVFLNIRNFRTYNETYGFAGGDRMLRSIARILQETFPASDVLARFADDHFAVVTSQDDLEERLARMAARVNNIRRGVIVEMKAGVYEVTDAGMDISLICDYAKLASDSIKQDYGVSFRLYDGKVSENVALQNYIVTHFENALSSGQIRIFYQPVVNVETGEVVSQEALARWETIKYGMIPPSDFIGVLEDQHLIHKLDAFIVDSVCEELHRRIKAGLPAAPVSLNLSRLDFELTDVVQTAEDAVAQWPIPKDLLRFEITESVIAMDMNALKREANRLRKHGFKVWMDAFGSGYSSLNVLKDFDLDGLKIDMDLVRSCNANEKASVIISAVIAMAKQLGIHALSKGVETQEQLDFLKGAGCKLAQGYLLGRPEPSPAGEIGPRLKGAKA